MHPQSTAAHASGPSLDPALAAFVAQRPISGPRPLAPLVQGALIITRLSKPKERMSSLGMQERHCREYCEHVLKMPVLAVYQDIKSGLIPGMARAGYQEAMTRARLRLASHIVVYDYDRFSRERVSSLQDYADLERLGLEVHDTLNGLIDHETAGQKAVAAEAEARKNSRRTYDNLMERHMNVEDHDSPRRAPFGYRKTAEPGRPEPEPRWAELVTQMFRRYDAGESEGSLRAWFNAVTGRRVRVESITRMLRNEYYAGIDIFNKRSRSKIRGSGAKDRDEWSTRRHEHALIDLATFERVQARLDEHAGQGQLRSAEARYALRGLVVCAACNYRCAGTTMHHRSGRRGTKPDVRVQCPQCRRTRAYDRVEGILLAHLQHVPLTVGHVQDEVRRRRDPVRSVEGVTKQIEAVRQRRARLLIRREDAAIAGDTTFSDADWRASIAESDRELSALEAERERIITGAKESATVETTLRWLQTLGSWTDVLDPARTTAAERNDVYRRCVRECTLDYDSDTLTVQWQPGIAHVLGRESDTLGLKDYRGASQPKG